LKSMVANLAGSKIEMLKIYTDNASTYIMAKFKLASSNMKNRFL
jgi:hypothetical protein